MDNAKELLEVVKGTKQAPNCDITLNLKATYAEDGIARAVWDVDERMINGVGVAMGGYVASAADITMAYAVASLLENKQSFFSINLQTTFHRPVSIGEAEVEARVEKRGRTMLFLVADVNQRGKLAATVHSSVMIVQAK
ncbi:MAG: PaaI family thioesterase [Bacillus sp. (in: Bacteria)]|nr:PaaI family thioesterase [Bacillus sp. (in: firmicutes)]